MFTTWLYTVVSNLRDLPGTSGGPRDHGSRPPAARTDRAPRHRRVADRPGSARPVGEGSANLVAPRAARPVPDGWETAAQLDLALGPSNRVSTKAANGFARPAVNGGIPQKTARRWSSQSQFLTTVMTDRRLKQPVVRSCLWWCSARCTCRRPRVRCRVRGLEGVRRGTTVHGAVAHPSLPAVANGA